MTAEKAANVGAWRKDVHNVNDAFMSPMAPRLASNTPDMMQYVPWGNEANPALGGVGDNFFFGGACILVFESQGPLMA